MKTVIYIDTLICINLFINYFVLLASIKFLNLKIARFRLILAASVGAFYSLIILLPNLNLFLSLFLKLIMSISIILIAFKILPLKVFLKAISIFYIINFLFAGVMFFFWYFIAPNGLFVKNGTIYYNLPAGFFIISTVVIYLLMKVFGALIGQREIPKAFCKIEIEYKQQSIKLNAKIDTGNTLKEPFSNIPVIVIDYNFIKDILPKEIIWYYSKNSKESVENVPYKIRLIPADTVTGTTLLPAFKPDCVKITINGHQLSKGAFVAVTKEKFNKENFEALINPELTD